MAREFEQTIVGSSFLKPFDQHSVNTTRMLHDLRETAIDHKSASLAQIRDLHRAIDYTITNTGSATLFRSLAQPLVDKETVIAKQKSINELRSRDKLRVSLADYLGEYAQGEAELFNFINGGRSSYGDIKIAMKVGAKLVELADEIPSPKTAYLRKQIEVVREHRESRIYQMMRGPIYKTPNGIRPREEIGILTPRLKFVPRHVTMFNISPSIPAVILMAGVFSGTIQADESTEKAAIYVASASTVGPYFSYFMIAGKARNDHDWYISPLKEKAVSDGSFIASVDAVGKMDELMSLLEYSRATGAANTTPKISDEGKHSFITRDLRNPVLGKNDPGFVPNDISLSDDRLTFITGPNSGGKSTMARTVVQTQLLAQIGSDVLASDASINIADRIFYQAPQYDALESPEGRFGTELARTRDIFFSATPQSLVILDELAEGTTAEERHKVTVDVLDGFNKIGCNTVLITHNHGLVYDYRNRGVGQALQVEFDSGENPTYKVIEGISTLSHALKVAQKIGFSEVDIERHLREKGYE